MLHFFSLPSLSEYINVVFSPRRPAYFSGCPLFRKRREREQRVHCAPSPALLLLFIAAALSRGEEETTSIHTWSPSLIQPPVFPLKSSGEASRVQKRQGSGDERAQIDRTPVSPLLLLVVALSLSQPPFL